MHTYYSLHVIAKIKRLRLMSLCAKHSKDQSLLLQKSGETGCDQGSAIATMGEQRDNLKLTLAAIVPSDSSTHYLYLHIDYTNCTNPIVAVSHPSHTHTPILPPPVALCPPKFCNSSQYSKYQISLMQK